jgi:modulator of drug activity B
MEEVEKHLWADVVIVQMPVYWMGAPWAFKKYVDEVYSKGTSGQFCHGDGRSTMKPKENYGGGGLLQSKKYMLSLTFNAPKEAFENPDEYLFQGKSVDDLFFPQHMCFRFFGMNKISTFVCHDVMKNSEIESDLMRLEKHIDQHF